MRAGAGSRGIGLRAAGALLAVLLLACGLWARWALRASLAQLDGARALPGLGARVSIERDARGVPTIRASSRLDVARGLGFVHAQERFFQMDLQRRLAAGELAALMGPAVLKYDRQYRIHRFREVARAVVRAAAPADRALLEAYAEGVNAGLGALRARPFEYLLLRQAPEPWLAEDSALCLLSMFILLQEDPGQRQSRLGYMHDALPPALYAFLAPDGTEWDAPLVGAPRRQPPVPGPEVCDLRKLGGQPQPGRSGARGPGRTRYGRRQQQLGTGRHAHP